MNIIVQKYGGSSLSNLDRMKIVAERIIQEKNNGNNIVVVVSAQGKTTNLLLEKAKEYSNYENNIMSKRDLDFLLATGEMQSASLLSILLNSIGHKSICITGFQAGILTDSNFTNAKILDIESKNIIELLNEEYIVIVTGFQGMDKFGNITTLGRGGSDLTAVGLASSLKAKKCEIFSDVDGIYSADPRIVENAKLLPYISYDEMLEASSSGAKVLHNRSVNLAKNNNIPIISKSSFNDSQGSEVSNKFVSENFDVTIISKVDNVSKITIIGSMLKTNLNALSKIYSLAQENNITIHMITISEISINLVVNSDVSNEFINILHEKLIQNKSTID